jgi:rSAM/selenodomain-associated transferase 1
MVFTIDDILMYPTQHLVIIAKAPRMGRVKTRLALDIGVHKAWSFYRHNLNSVVKSLAKSSGWKTWLSVSPDESINKNHIWPARAQRISQGFGDLGKRMDKIMRLMPIGPTIIIGADIPEINSSNISDAFRLLGHKDVVLGPAQDGGYWLIGQRRRPRTISLFTNVRWSSPHTLADTMQNIPGLAKAGYVAKLSDIDNGKAYQDFIQRRHLRDPKNPNK